MVIWRYNLLLASESTMGDQQLGGWYRAYMILFLVLCFQNSFVRLFFRTSFENKKKNKRTFLNESVLKAYLKTNKQKNSFGKSF